MKQWLFLLIVLAVLAAGCQEDLSSDAADELPYNLIHSEFSYTPFEIPEQWEVVSVSSEVEHQYQDWEEPENHQYAEVPFRYTINFGRKADENSVADSDLAEFNEQQELRGETTRQLYYHTYYEHFGVLHISRNGFVRMISNLGDAEEWELSGEKAMVLRDGNEWVMNIYINGVYYDLLVLGEAGLATEDEGRELLEEMFTAK